MSIHHIKRITRSERYRRYAFAGPGFDGIKETGDDLHMKDGSVWFHPYTGKAPRQIK